MDVAALWVGWLLVWTLGIAVVAALRGLTRARVSDGDIAFLVGGGWFVGQFLLTLWMRVLSAAGIPFGQASIVGPLAAATIAAMWFAARRRVVNASDARSGLRALFGTELAGAERVLWIAVMVWLVVRLALLLFEVTVRPLYPWDAWTQWATKARVWFALKTIVPFVGAPDWFTLPADTAYYDAAPTYPGTVPLSQVWSATLLGRFDDALVNLPWWLTALAFGFALYGFLRSRRLSSLASLLGTWIALSLPILDAHVALAGYADLAMATYLATATFAWLRYAQQRVPADLAVAIVLTAACIVIKNPGKVWVLTLLPGVVAAFFPRYRSRIAVAFVALAALVALVATRGGLTILGYQTQLNFRMPWRSLADAYFVFANWHLLFFGAIVAAVLGWRRLLEPGLAPLTITVLLGIGFLAFGFAFTNAGAWVEDQSTVNRATLHLAPLLVAWMVLTYRDWSQTWAATRDVR